VQALLREAVDDFLHTEDDLRRLEGVDRVASLAKSRLPVRRKDKTNQSGFQPVYMADSRIAYETMARLAVTLNDCGTHRGAVVFGLGSPTRGAGTSLLAAHLARVLSETGQRVLLIDANWKRKSAGQAPLSVCHGGKLDRWLGTVTLGPEALAVLMLRATRPVSELDASISIASAIEILRAEQDYIVVDFHSLDQTADFEAGLPNVDRVMLVAEAGRTRARDLRELLRRLPARKLGAVVLNKA
jgi:Mrp family chromosome partitioning ATPase